MIRDGRNGSLRDANRTKDPIMVMMMVMVMVMVMVMSLFAV